MYWLSRFRDAMGISIRLLSKFSTQGHKNTHKAPNWNQTKPRPRPTLTSDACVWSICNSIWSELVEMIDSHSLVKSSTEHFAAFLDEELDSDKNHVMCVFFLANTTNHLIMCLKVIWVIEGWDLC